MSELVFVYGTLRPPRPDTPAEDTRYYPRIVDFIQKVSQAELQGAELRTPEDALQALIVFGFENRRLKRLHLRGRGRDRVWAEPEQQQRIAVLMRQRKR